MSSPVPTHPRLVYRTALLALVISTLCLAASDPNESRTWTSAKGNHKIEAALVEVVGDSVKLRRADGQEITVPLAQLSAADREYVKSLEGDDIGSDLPDGEGSKKKIVTAAELEAEVAELKSAKQIVMVYKFHLAADDLPPHERKKAEERMAHWQEMAEKGFERIGKTWLSGEEAEKLRTQVKEKITLGYEQLRLGNADRSRKLLEEASKLDPDNINADFIMGMVYSLIADNDAKAIKHFKICLQREPSNVGVLNNLAICYFYEKDYNRAADAWMKAVNISPDTPALGQNLGSLITLASNDRRVKIAKRRLDEVSEAYEKLITKHGHAPPAKVTFVWLPPAGFQTEEEKKADGKKQQIVMGSGTGFVIAPHIIATNHHVIEGAEKIMILDPNDTSKNLPGELIAADEEIDVAVIRCPTFNGKPLPLCTSLPARGSDIAVLGYPLGSAFGNSVKLTRGTMVAMPDAANDNLCLYDAITNPGNSGGPLVDFEGRVVGVVRAIKGYTGGVYGMAIPMERAWPWFKKHVPELQDPQKSPVSVPISLPEVDKRCAPSTVMVLQMQSA